VGVAAGTSAVVPGAAVSTAFLQQLNFRGRHVLPGILQTEAAECGLACLAMIAGYHGRRTDLNRLRREHAVSLKGSTLKSLMDIAHRLGFTSRALRLELTELRELRKPAILHWNLNHFVVLRQIRGDTALIHDPAVGLRRLPLETVSKHFTGVALELLPAPGFEARDERETLKLRQLWSEAVGLKRFLIQLLLLSLALQAFALLSPFYVQLVVDEAVVRLDPGFLGLLAAGFLLVILLQTAIGWIRSWVLMYMGTLLSLQVQGNLLRHLLRLPLGFFQKRHIGDIVSRFGSMSAIQNLLTTGLVEAVVDGLMLVLTITVMLVYQPQLTALAAALLSVYGLIRWVRYRALRELSVEQLVASAEAGSQFMETIRGMPTIKLFGLEQDRLGQWQNRAVGVANTSIRIARLDIGFGVANRILTGAAHIGIVYLGAMMVMEQQFTVGMLMAFLAYQGQFLGAGGRLIDQWIAYRLLDIHLDRLSDIALATPEEKEIPAPVPVRNLPASFSLQRVSFRYSADEPRLLDDVSIDVPDGGCIVILGPSGVGKSTLLRIALGLEQPEAGTVELGGVDIRKLGLSNYRRMAGAVTQEDRLLSGSIAENITLFDPHPDTEHMVACARLCAMHDVIMRMPMNYHSLIGDMGDILSAGERQRLMLARALYRRPRILFLDEATSNLDPALDEQINRMLAELQITRVIVTHRATAQHYANQVYRMAPGRLQALPDGAALERPAGHAAAVPSAA
jgi:ATP-binding cassette, subfamily B, bacterial CvaB/MchF/RaxB